MIHIVLNLNLCIVYLRVWGLQYAPKIFSQMQYVLNVKVMIPVSFGQLEFEFYLKLEFHLPDLGDIYIDIDKVMD